MDWSLIAVTDVYVAVLEIDTKPCRFEALSQSKKTSPCVIAVVLLFLL